MPGPHDTPDHTCHTYPKPLNANHDRSSGHHRDGIVTGDMDLSPVQVSESQPVRDHVQKHEEFAAMMLPLYKRPTAAT